METCAELPLPACRKAPRTSSDSPSSGGGLATREKRCSIPCLSILSVTPRSTKACELRVSSVQRMVASLNAIRRCPTNQSTNLPDSSSERACLESRSKDRSEEQTSELQS